MASASPQLPERRKEMPSFRSCLVFFALLAGASAAAPALAETSLAEAVRAADAKYLSVEELQETGDAPRIEGGSGEELLEPEAREIAQGDVKATLTYRETASEDGETARVPVVTIFAGGEEVAKLEGEELGLSDPPIAVQIAEIDPANSEPEVVVSFFTGGAHCCSDTKVITKTKDGPEWRTVALGQFDGGPLLANDVAGDGRYVFEIRDNAFLYAFACYACSAAPLKVQAVAGGEVEDLSADPKYRPAHEAYLRDMILNVPDEDVNGFLAGYVAEKIRLGEGRQAWALMLDHCDRESDWGLELCDQPLDEDGACPGTATKATFPEALERMLNENGYSVGN
jgi:hypothetical protein